MNLIDKIEDLGIAVDAGLLPRDEAIKRLEEFSQGGLTKIGATRAIDNWHIRREEYGRVLKSVLDGLKRLDGLAQ